jgi:hypothetical protein
MCGVNPVPGGGWDLRLLLVLQAQRQAVEVVQVGENQILVRLRRRLLYLR